MRIAVLGGGRVGSALAESWREKGHDVSVSTRETVADTAAGGDVVVLAVPATAATEVLGEAGSLDGKILVDATNNLSGGPPGLVHRRARAEGAVREGVQRGVRVLHARHADEPSRLARLLPGRRRREGVGRRLIRDVGLEPVDAGGSEVTPLVEAFAQLIIGIAYAQGRGPFVVPLPAELRTTRPL